MLRAAFVSTIASLSILVLLLGQAVAGPVLGDDVATCRERQPDFKVRVDACERLIAAGQVKGKDLAVALAIRGEALSQKRDYDNAIAAFNSAVEADPDNIRIVEARAIAHQQVDPATPLYKIPSFRLLFLTRVASTTAFQMLSVVVGWHVYELTNSALHLGLIGLAQFVAPMLLMVPAGQIVDRYNRRLVLRCCYVGAFLSSAANAPCRS